MYRYLTGDVDYLNSYTKGFSTLPTPAQVGGQRECGLSCFHVRLATISCKDSTIRLD
ncbi:unnamed protein product [Ectocarpus sp. 12 AP-2014]